MRAPVLAGLAAATLAAGCAHRVEVTLPAAPAIHLDSDSVAVIAGERACRDLADGLVEQLNALDGMEVDPRSDVRLHVLQCRTHFDPRVDITVSSDEEWRGRVTVVGRGHAVLAVEAGGEVQAHLIGSAQRFANGEAEGGQVVTLRRRVSRALVQGVAADLAEQVRPMPRVVERRVFPNAPSDSARGHLDRAVRAELAGDLDEARRQAAMAHELRPTSWSAAYVAELDRLSRRLDSSTDSAYEAR